MQIKSRSPQADRKGNTPKIEFKTIFIFVFSKWLLILLEICERMIPA
jgi:hypothetical protein